MSETREQSKEQSKPKAKPSDIEHPQPTAHSDNAKSKMPERADADRKQSPADHPGKKPGEGEPSVS